VESHPSEKDILKKVIVLSQIWKTNIYLFNISSRVVVDELRRLFLKN